jgi:transcriptional regulator with XRE-family HTH domain
VTPAPRLEQTDIRTPLAEWRVKRGMTQRELYRAAGISRGTYIAMEQGRHDNPQIRLLANCAIVLGVDICQLIAPEWKEWWDRYDPDATAPEEPSAFWHGGAASGRGAPAPDC